MSPKKTSIQQTRELARAEYEQKTKSLLFTKDFQSRQKVVMHDPLASVGTRVMSWILLHSWGEYVLYAMRSDGHPAFQRDCARELKLDKRRVADAVSYLQQRGYLENRPKLLYPVISPVLASPPPKDEKSGAYRTFLQFWKVQHAADFEDLEVARATVKRITKVLHAEYRKSEKEVKKAGASLLETARQVPETGQRAAVSPLEESNRRHQRTPAQPPVDEVMQTKAQAAAYLMQEIGKMQRAYPNTPFAKPLIDPNDAGDKGLVHRILHEIGAEPDGRFDEQRIVSFIVHCMAQFKGWGLGGGRKAMRAPDDPTGPQGLGLLTRWARDYSRIDRQTRRAV